MDNTRTGFIPPGPYRTRWTYAVAAAPLAPAVNVTGLMALITPGYFAPLLTAGSGLLMGAAGVAFLILSYGLGLMGARALLVSRSNRRVAVGIPLLCGALLLTVPTLFVVLLGPAILVIEGAAH